MSFPLKSGNHLSWPSTNWEALYIPQTQKSPLKSHSFPFSDTGSTDGPFYKGTLFALLFSRSVFMVAYLPNTSYWSRYWGHSREQNQRPIHIVFKL